MEFDELMNVRRSVRVYKEGQELDRETILELVKAAQQGPTWKNSQTGRYYIVTSPEKIEEVRTSCLPMFNQQRCVNAGALIVTTFVRGESGFNDGEPANELVDKWGAYDLGLCNAYLILKAADLGLGTLIMGIRDGEALRAQLNIPETEDVVAVISVGTPDRDPVYRPRKETEEIVKFF